MRFSTVSVTAVLALASISTYVSAFTTTTSLSSSYKSSTLSRTTNNQLFSSTVETTTNGEQKVVEQEEEIQRKTDKEVFGKHQRPKSFATKCASLYHPNKSGAERGLAPPVYFGSTFLLDDAAHGARLHEKREQPYVDDDGFVYSRWGSPTCEAAALQIAALEGVDDPKNDPNGQQTGKCLLFNSGMSAITSSLMSVLKSGDHAIFPYTVYGGTHEFVENFCKVWGIDVTYVDSSGKDGPQNYKNAFRDNTKVVYTETPANPTMRLTDLEGVAKIVDEHYGTVEETSKGISDVHERKRPWIMVDGTFATPYHQRVLDIPGIDVSIHSATKYLGGHSDLLAGSVTSRSEQFLHSCSKVQKLITVPLNPMDSFLLARGLRTLDVRMERHGKNAMKIATMLEKHPAVKSVYYPGLKSHPDRDMADSLFMSGRDVNGDNEYNDDLQTYGGMVTFIMAGKDEDSDDDDTALQRARNVCEHLRVINLAVSLGGVESLVEHPASMTHTMIPKEQRMKGGLDDGLIRLSVGLENIRDLMNDLQRALDKCDENGCDIDYDTDDDF